MYGIRTGTSTTDVAVMPGRLEGTFGSYHNYDENPELRDNYKYGLYKTSNVIIPEEFRKQDENSSNYDWALIVLDKDIDSRIVPDSIGVPDNDYLYDNRERREW